MYYCQFGYGVFSLVDQNYLLIVRTVKDVVLGEKKTCASGIFKYLSRCDFDRQNKNFINNTKVVAHICE
jgi:hypothetical protein